MPKYSIIVPVYNTKKYLRNCLESLKNQVFRDFEVILIDDCSTDDSYDICKEICVLDNRFKVIRQERNAGQSVARNKGIDIAEGEYILFVDSDDYVSPHYLEEINQQKGEYDLFCWGNYNVQMYESDVEKIEISSMNVDVVAENVLLNKWEELFKGFFLAPWNKLYKADIIKDNHIYFDSELCCYEDYVFTIEYCKNVSSFKSISNPLYYYRLTIGENSILKRKWKELFAVSNTVYNKTEDFIEKTNNQGLEYMFLVAYRAYMIECEYAYLKGMIDDAITKIVSIPEFRKCLYHTRRFAKYIRAVHMADIIRNKRIMKMLILYYIGKDLKLK